MAMSVVMATYNRRALLPTVLDPLLADPATLEVVVVVDGCDDGSIEYLEKMAQHEGHLRPIFIENSGGVRAQQVGLEAAVGDVVLILDDDVIAAPGLVTGHARHHEERPGLLVVVGYMPISPPQRRLAGSFVAELYRDVYERRCLAWEADSRNILRSLWGGNVSVPRRALLTAGGMSGDHPLRYHFDWDLGLRLRRAGLHGRFDRALAARHLYDRSYETFKREARAQGRDLWLIEHVHRGTLGPEAIRDRHRDRTWALPWLVGLTDRPRIYRAMTASLDTGVRWSGRVRAFWLERKLGALLGHVERRRGEYEQSRITPHPRPWRPDLQIPPGGADA
ncbi:MAG: glycosyltransferase [Solirubrobacteraceae bacterium]